MSIGENIKIYRKKRGLTQEQLAKLSGLSKNAIYNYENNKRTPSVDIANKIANALEVSLYSLNNPLSFLYEDIAVADREFKIDKIKTKFINNEILTDEELGLLRKYDTDTIMNNLNKVDNKTVKQNIDEFKVNLCKDIFQNFGYTVKNSDNELSIMDNSGTYKEMLVSLDSFSNLSNNVHWALDSFIERYIDENNNGFSIYDEEGENSGE